MSCSYAQPSNRKRPATNVQSSNASDDMQNRIDRLEGLVLSLMTNGNQSAGPAAAQRALSMDSSTGSAQPNDVDINTPDGSHVPNRGEGSEESETDQVVQSLGVMKVDNNSKSTMYIGDTHWASVLSDVSIVTSPQDFIVLTSDRFPRSGTTLPNIRSSMKNRSTRLIRRKPAWTRPSRDPCSSLAVASPQNIRSF